MNLFVDLNLPIIILLIFPHQEKNKFNSLYLISNDKFATYINLLLNSLFIFIYENIIYYFIIYILLLLLI